MAQNIPTVSPNMYEQVGVCERHRDRDRGGHRGRGKEASLLAPLWGLLY